MAMAATGFELPARSCLPASGLLWLTGAQWCRLCHLAWAAVLIQQHARSSCIHAQLDQQCLPEACRHTGIRAGRPALNTVNINAPCQQSPIPAAVQTFVGSPPRKAHSSSVCSIMACGCCHHVMPVHASPHLPICSTNSRCGSPLNSLGIDDAARLLLTCTAPFKHAPPQFPPLLTSLSLRLSAERASLPPSLARLPPPSALHPHCLSVQIILASRRFIQPCIPRNLVPASLFEAHMVPCRVCPFRKEV